MGVLVNQQLNPKIYKKRIKVKNISNQTTYRTNYLQEYMNHQQRLTHELVNSFKHVHSSLQVAKTDQQHQLVTLLSRIEEQEALSNKLMEKITSQDIPFATIIERLEKLESRNEDIVKSVEADEVINQAIMDELSYQNQATQKYSKKLEEFESTYKELIDQQKVQADLYEQISNRLTVQEAFHETILNEVSQQRTLIQTLSKQLENIKAMIVEKITPVIEKIEGFFTKPTFITKVPRTNRIKEKEANTLRN